MANQGTSGNGEGTTIEQLIRATEDRTRAEERVRMLLVGIERGQLDLGRDIRALSMQVETLSRCVSGIQQMVVVVAQYMAILAGKSTEQVQEITRDLLAKSGISFADGAHVDIGGDMVGGDSKGD